MSTGHEYVGGTHSSGIVSIAADVVGIVREMRGVWWSGSGRCMRSGRVVWIRGLGLCSTNPVGTGGVSMFGLLCRGWCRWGVGIGLGPRSGRVTWCYICVSCEYGLFV